MSALIFDDFVKAAGQLIHLATLPPIDQKQLDLKRANLQTAINMLGSAISGKRGFNVVKPHLAPEVHRQSWQQKKFNHSLVEAM